MSLAPPVHEHPFQETPDGFEVPHVWDNSTHGFRALGLNPIPDLDRPQLPKFSAKFATIPRSKWKPVDTSGWTVRQMDQKQTSSCVGHGSACAYELLWKMSGLPPLEFSGCYVYALGNGGHDAGMNISAAAEILIKNGICLESEFSEGHIWARQISPQARQSALKHRLLDYYHFETFDEAATAIQLGFTIFYGIYVSNDFGNLDQELVAPAYPGEQANHCMCSVKGLRNLASGRWAIPNRNSWGSSWGAHGECYLIDQHFTGGTDGIAIRAVQWDSSQSPIPKSA